MKREDLNKIRDKLKIGSKVECKVNTGGDFNSTGAKIRKGVVTEKYDEHLIACVKDTDFNFVRGYFGEVRDLDLSWLDYQDVIELKISL